MSKYLEFRLLEQKEKTQVIEVASKFYGRLGIIKWFGSWRRYAFFPDPGTTFDTVCLNDIGSYMKKLGKEVS